MCTTGQETWSSKTAEISNGSIEVEFTYPYMLLHQELFRECLPAFPARERSIAFMNSGHMPIVCAFVKKWTIAYAASYPCWPLLLPWMFLFRGIIRRASAGRDFSRVFPRVACPRPVVWTAIIIWWTPCLSMSRTARTVRGRGFPSPLWVCIWNAKHVSRELFRWLWPVWGFPHTENECAQTSNLTTGSSMLFAILKDRQHIEFNSETYTYISSQYARASYVLDVGGPHISCMFFTPNQYKRAHIDIVESKVQITFCPDPAAVLYLPNRRVTIIRSTLPSSSMLFRDATEKGVRNYLIIDENQDLRG